MSKLSLATLCVLALAGVASADPAPTPPPDDGTVEHFEYRWKTTISERVTTTVSPTRAVVERSWSETSDEEWSHSHYVGATWMTDDGVRSDAVGGQTSTVRKRKPRWVPRPIATQRSPTIGSQSPCSSSRTRCCAE